MDAARRAKSREYVRSLPLLEGGRIGVISVAGACAQVTLIELDLDVVVLARFVGGKGTEADLVP